MPIKLTEHERDARDLKILKLLDTGMSQKQVADAVGVSRGSFQRLLADIREDDRKQLAQAA